MIFFKETSSDETFDEEAVLVEWPLKTLVYIPAKLKTSNIHLEIVQDFKGLWGATKLSKS